MATLMGNNASCALPALTQMPSVQNPATFVRLAINVKRERVSQYRAHQVLMQTDQAEVHARHVQQTAFSQNLGLRAAWNAEHLLWRLDLTQPIRVCVQTVFV
jgi:hypothetical protein